MSSMSSAAFFVSPGLAIGTFAELRDFSPPPSLLVKSAGCSHRSAVSVRSISSRTSRKQTGMQKVCNPLENGTKFGPSLTNPRSIWAANCPGGTRRRAAAAARATHGKETPDASSLSEKPDLAGKASNELEPRGTPETLATPAETYPPSYDTIWTVLHFSSLGAIFFPPNFLLPPGISPELQTSDMSAPLAIAVGAASLLLVLKAFLDLGSSFHPLPKPIEGSQLKTSGLYSLVRHPMYSFQIVLFFCVAIASGSTMRLLMSVVLAAALSGKAGAEEVHLVRRYGAEYTAYQQSVKMLLPFLY